MIKVGIAGYGKAIEEFHLPNIKDSGRFELVSVFDITPARRDLAKKETGAAVYGEYKDFLNSRPDFVIIATPSNSHHEYALRAIGAGIGVVVEKPLALTAADCEEIIERAKSKKVLLTVHHNRRWDGDYLAVKEIVDSCRLGKIKFIASRVANYGPLLGYSVPEFDTAWRYKKGFGGGQLHDFGAHLIDQLLNLTGEMPSEIKCEVKNEVWSKETDTYFKLSLGFKSEISAEIVASQISKESLPRWEIRGEKGSLLCEAGTDSIRVKTNGKEEVVDSKQNQHHKFYDNLHDAIIKNSGLAVKPEQARDVVAIIEKAYKVALSSSLA